jgi:hypothetical protein
MTDSTRTPHPLNVPGPFYVLDQCCTNCGVPKLFAKENFASTPDHHCYVSRQPAGESELKGMLDVIVHAELACIRYAGSNVRILQRLADAEAADQCDNPQRIPIRAVCRDYVSFRTRGHTHPALVDVLSDVRDRLLRTRNTFRATDVATVGARASFSVAWHENDFHLIELTESPVRPGYFLLHHLAPHGLGQSIDDVLRGGEYDDILWSHSPSADQPYPHPW